MLFIIGLVLILAGPWFEDQQTVGYIFLIPGVIELLWYFIVIGAMIFAVKK